MGLNKGFLVGFSFSWGMCGEPCPWCVGAHHFSPCKALLTLTGLAVYQCLQQGRKTKPGQSAKIQLQIKYSVLVVYVTRVVVGVPD
jgi:hypothetical protein